MSVCAGREGAYLPWSFGEWFACSTCGQRVRQSHTIPALRGEGYTAVYPIPVHDSPVGVAETTEKEQQQ